MGSNGSRLWGLLQYSGVRLIRQPYSDQGPSSGPHLCHCLVSIHRKGQLHLHDEAKSVLQQSIPADLILSTQKLQAEMMIHLAGLS